MPCTTPVLILVAAPTPVDSSVAPELMAEALPFVEMLDSDGPAPNPWKGARADAVARPLTVHTDCLSTGDAVEEALRPTRREFSLIETPETSAGEDSPAASQSSSMERLPTAALDVTPVIETVVVLFAVTVTGDTEAEPVRP